MNPYRITTMVLSLLLGWFALTTIFAEKFSVNLGQSDHRLLANWATAMVLMRGDLLGENAVALAAQTLNSKKMPPASEKADIQERALTLARQALSLSPHLSKVWLLLATLNDSLGRPGESEALKMSYLTSPGDVDLISQRLAIATASTAITDDEVRALVRRDLRAILATRPDLRSAIVDAYRHGSPEGKAYVEETTKAIDPNFAATLH
jgi:CRP-like cAMP-binding protein